MTIDDIIAGIEEKIKVLSKKELVKAWNWVYPEEERITESALSSKNPGNEEQLIKEISDILVDEISGLDTKGLIKAYNKFSSKEERITLEDLEGGEDDSEEELDEDM